jgi:hypothetical protein
VCQPIFMTTVTEFLFLPWREAMREVVDGAGQGGSQVGGWLGCCREGLLASRGSSVVAAAVYCCLLGTAAVRS